jgi:hypothetical protein
MALTDDEQRLLAQIAEDLAQQDRRLARKLGTCPTRSTRMSASDGGPGPPRLWERPRLRIALLCLVMATAVLSAVAGILVKQPVLSALAVLLTSIAALGTAVAQPWRPRRR